MGGADAATRLALVGGEGNGGVENVLDIATALLGKDANLQLLDRAEVGRVLREHELSLAGLVGAEHAVKAGQLLQADLFAVLEGSPANETESSAVGRATLQRSRSEIGNPANETESLASLGLVVFDAKTGARYADSALLASNTASAAAATAEAVRAAAAKYHRKPEDLQTVGLLLVRNADLPRQFDGLCDTVGLLLERELTASPGIAVLERRRLEQVTKERSVAPDAEGNRLLSSLRMIELDISQDGAGLRGALALVGADGARTNAVTASVPARDAAALAHLLADKTERFLKAPPDGLPPNRAAEAARFHREYLMLLQHRDLVAAVHPLDAAIALASEHSDWQLELALLLPPAAVDCMETGVGYLPQPSRLHTAAEKLTACLALGQRGADLLLDLSREAAARAKPDEPVPEVLSGTSYLGGLHQLRVKLADARSSADASGAAEIDVLAAKERTLRMEVIEPFLAKRSVDKDSFSYYSFRLFWWFNLEPSRFAMRSEERLQDDLLALSHWVELSHKLNPPDGSGIYGLIANSPLGNFFTYHRGSPVEAFRQTLEQDQDPVIRLYAHAARLVSYTYLPDSKVSVRGPGGLVTLTNARALFGPVAMNSLKPVVTDWLEGEREFRLYAQDLLTRGDIAKSAPFRTCVWEAIEGALSGLNIRPECWKENVEACQFALAQGDVRVGMFKSAAMALNDPSHRDVPQALEIANAAIKLIREKPDTSPPATNNFFSTRTDPVKDLEQIRDQLAAELVGVNTNPQVASTNAQIAPTNIPAPAPWKQQVCLFDLTKPKNGLAWLFKPVVQDGQVFAVTLGLHQWGASEDNLQLVCVPLEGGAPSFLGRAKHTGFNWVNGPTVLQQGLESRLKYDAPDVGRAACVGGGCHFAATSSGVFIFPTNGGPVAHLGATNGLPSDDTHAVAFLDGKLYISAGELGRDGYLAAYDLASQKIAVLASSRRREHISPFDDQPPFCAIGLYADPIRHRLFMAVSSLNPRATIPAPRLASRTNQLVPAESMGIWSYLPSTGEYVRLAPLYIPNSAASLYLPNGPALVGLVDANTLVIKESFLLAVFDLRNARLLSAQGAWAGRAATTDTVWRSPIPDLPPLLTDNQFEPKESPQLLDDGKHVLAADHYSLWLLELKPEAAQAPAVDDKSNPALGKP